MIAESTADHSGLSKSIIGRIWRKFQIKSHLTDTFKLSTDPLFVEKVYVVVGLYFNPPEGAVVLASTRSRRSSPWTLPACPAIVHPPTGGPPTCARERQRYAPAVAVQAHAHHVDAADAQTGVEAAALWQVADAVVGLPGRGAKHPYLAVRRGQGAQPTRGAEHGGELARPRKDHPRPQRPAADPHGGPRAAVGRCRRRRTDSGAPSARTVARRGSL
ncbi:hypothetical protein ACIOG7_36945 [Streptomyces sp. NPDC087894]|uniref:hypothetical protein n=1 Tax=Streptomyces sp. NPDC087894 TaxID=3365816 RepID=UPI0037FDFAC9